MPSVARPVLNAVSSSLKIDVCVDAESSPRSTMGMPDSISFWRSMSGASSSRSDRAIVRSFAGASTNSFVVDLVRLYALTVQLERRRWTLPISLVQRSEAGPWRGLI